MADPAALIAREADRLTEALLAVAREAVEAALAADAAPTVPAIVAALEDLLAILPLRLVEVVNEALPEIAQRAIAEAEAEIVDAREASGEPFPEVPLPPTGNFADWSRTAAETMIANLTEATVEAESAEAARGAVLAALAGAAAAQLAAMADTGAARMVNAARVSAFGANRDIVAKVRVRTVPDADRSEVCTYMNGAEFSLDGRPVPTPPFHANCRSTLVPVLASAGRRAAPETLELRFAPADVSTAGSFSGIALAYDVLDAHGTAFAPGCFAAAIAERRAAGQRFPILLHHDPERVAGVVTELRDTRDGLAIEGRFLLETRDGTEGYALAKSGGMALSVGFKRLADQPRPGGGRTITRARLAEISLVAVASNPRARLTEVRSQADPSRQDHEEEKIMEDENTNTGGAEETRTTADLTTVTTSVSALEKRLDKIEARSARAGLSGGDEGAGDQLETRSFTHFLRRGREAMGADEVRSLRTSDDTAGGYLAPDQFVAELLRNLVRFSPIRSVARVANTNAGAVILPKRTGTLTAQWVGETGARPDTAPTYGQNRFPVCEVACYVDASNAMLEDSALDIAGELAFDFAEEFGKAEGSAFVDGAGALQPAGFMNDDDILNTVSGEAAAITADGLIQLYHDLPAAYRANATWCMNSNTIGTVSKLKDGTSGQYLMMTQGIANAPATTLLGRPVIEAPDMPDIGAGDFPAIFGDFSQFRIFDRIQLSVLRDPYSQAANGMTRFHARRRVAAGVAKSEAFRKLKIASS
ncbi:phage major capsid protein [Oceanibaculum indicum]|uniref:Phage major capsid protein, HK97 family n=1 Tax=Oceanibaculum indicum P24 TaxID=1207063 RepID=K2JM81_9PROT|nr:phage major capsid protein [Oceanibaculum indicum]EKE75517.1 Phage major capsid protein, HK97 family [Oceanibaculum indicum P24]